MQISKNTSLSEWSPGWIENMLENDQGEEALFDFKEGIDSQDPKHNHNIRKAIASFANTEGGFLIFGIQDIDKAKGWNRLRGVSGNDAKFSKELTDIISHGEIVPHIFFQGPRVLKISHDEKEYSVFIVKIDVSELKPHAVVNKGSGLLEFWMRGNASAVVMTYPYLTKIIEESSELKNVLAALYLDCEYIGSFGKSMLISEERRHCYVPPIKIRSLVNSDNLSQLISKIPTDVELVALLWKLREHIDTINHYWDIMETRRALPLTNNDEQIKWCNDGIASLVPIVEKKCSDIRGHLVHKYANVREWLSVVQSKSKE